MPAKPPGDVLELACGTGLVTAHLRQRLDSSVRLVATDLSKPMLEYARAKLGERPNLEFREADAGKLPFADGEFGAVVCAFGAMFVPDKAAFFSEARRVLRPGGLCLISVWGRVEDNPHAKISADVVQSLFPDERDVTYATPYTMSDSAAMRRYLEAALFVDIRVETVRLRLNRVSAKTFAIGQMRGTPRGALITKRGGSIEVVAERIAAALAAAGGADPYDGPAAAIVAEARAPA
jgi:ubiquinone/menaquinone biosynthesis C-methylase UbiE